jgi:1,4-dihydroxy-2-naphthoyl-CoA hydrolase
MFRPEITPDVMNQRGIGSLPRFVGIEVVSIAAEGLVGRLAVRPDLLAPHGYLHAASVIALADTMAGYGTIANLPAGATTFTTIELKSNFLGTARGGVITCKATPMHLGRMTHVWDAVVMDEAERKIALFRCTQMILWDKK